MDPVVRRDPYKVLQVDPEADLDVIQAAYRRLAQRHHPDVSAKPESPAMMAELNAAWELLRDPGRRAVLDRERAAASASGRGAALAGREPAPAERSESTPGGAVDPPVHRPRPEAEQPVGQTRPAPGQGPTREPESVSRDWTSGRSGVGSTYDPSMRRPDGEGAAGPPPGNPSGSLLNFGRYRDWSLGEIARVDLDYVEWLDRTPIGRPYREEIDAILRRTGRRRSAAADEGSRRGLFRRR